MSDEEWSRPDETPVTFADLRTAVSLVLQYVNDTVIWQATATKPSSTMEEVDAAGEKALAVFARIRHIYRLGDDGER